MLKIVAAVVLAGSAFAAWVRNEPHEGLDLTPTGDREFREWSETLRQPNRKVGPWSVPEGCNFGVRYDPTARPGERLTYAPLHEITRDHEIDE